MTNINQYLKNYIKFETSDQNTHFQLFKQHDTNKVKNSNTLQNSNTSCNSTGIKLMCEKLTVDFNYLTDNSIEILDEFYNNKELKKKQLIDYKKNRFKWTQELNQYTCKLPLLIKNKCKDRRLKTFLRLSEIQTTLTFSRL